MLSQHTKTVLILAVAIYVGYLYTFSDSDSDSTDSGKVSYVSLHHIKNIHYNQKMGGKLKAFVLGATGGTGKEVVKALAADARFEKVTLIGRRPIPLNPEENPGHAKMENQIIDFEKLDEYRDVFKGYDVGFSCMGTTKKQSGPELYYRVDHDYVVNSAKLAKEGGCRHYHVVTAAGANKNSYFEYPKIKGEVEEELSEMDFPRLSIYRPAVLLVEEAREEFRLGEGVLRSILKPCDRMRWFSIDVPLMAKVMVANCFREPSSQIEILSNSAINKFAKELGNGNVPPTPGANATDSSPFQ